MGSPQNTGYGFASWMLGYPSSGSAQSPALSAGIQYYGGLYINDAWRVNRKLTVNVGVRWEQPGSFSEKHVSLTSLDLSLPQPGEQFDYNHDRIARRWADAEPWRHASNPFPNGIATPPGRSQAYLNSLIGQGIGSPLQNQPFPYTQQWNLDVQYQIANGLMADVGYSGAKRSASASLLGQPRSDPRFRAIARKRIADSGSESVLRNHPGKRRHPRAEDGTLTAICSSPIRSICTSLHSRRQLGIQLTTPCRHGYRRDSAIPAC